MTTGEFQTLATAIEKLVKQGETAEETSALVVDAELTESGARAKRELGWDRWLKVVTLIAAIAAGGGGFSAYRSYTAPPPPTPTEVAAPVRLQVKAGAAELTEKVETNDRKIRNLGGAVIDLQDQQAETMELLGKKMDAISPRAKAIKIDSSYPALQKAAKKRAEKKHDERVDDIFEGGDK